MKSQAKYALLPSYDDIDDTAPSTKAKISITDGCWSGFGSQMVSMLSSKSIVAIIPMLFFACVGISLLVRHSWVPGWMLLVLSLLGCFPYIRSQAPLFALCLTIDLDTCIVFVRPDNLDSPSSAWYISVMSILVIALASWHFCVTLMMFTWVGLYR